MNCPRCVKPLAHGEPHCGGCGFSMEALDEVWGSDSVFLERVTDTAGALDALQRAEVDAALDGFEADFPQLFLAVFIGALPTLTNLRQFGYWLLNRSAVADLEITRPNENGALLIIDTNAGSAALATGYLLEFYFTDEDLLGLLNKGRKCFGDKNFSQGILNICAAFSQEIRRKAAAERKRPGRFAPKREENPEAPSFRRVHAGQTNKSEEAATGRENPTSPKQ